MTPGGILMEGGINMDERYTIRALALRDGMNYETAIKRRRAAGLGLLIPPGTWLLFEDEWAIVRDTPLPGCTGKRF